jgi:hypothetical protein
MAGTGLRKHEPILILGDMQVEGRRSDGSGADSGEYLSLMAALKVRPAASHDGPCHRTGAICSRARTDLA